MSMFAPARKTQAYARLALESPAGFGKTFTALRVAARLVEGTGNRVALLDTEYGSAAKYAHLFDFDHAAMDPPFHPDRAVAAIRDAYESGHGVFILDSVSHFWTGAGGLLEVHREIAKNKYRGDGHRAWDDAGEIQQRLVDAILRTPMHIIVCFRTKKEYVREEGDNGRTRIRAAGTKVIQRDEFDYEFDLVGRFDQPGVMALTKSRCDTLPVDSVITRPGEEFADVLAAWLRDGDSAPVPVVRDQRAFPVPHNWQEVQEAVLPYGEGVWQEFQGFMRAAKAADERFADNGVFRQAAAGVACWLRDRHDPSEFPPPGTAELQAGWATAVDGVLLEPLSVPAPEGGTGEDGGTVGAEKSVESVVGGADDVVPE